MPKFEWCVVGRGSKNLHQNIHVFKRDWTTLRSQNMLTILGLIMDMIGKLRQPLNEYENIH